MALCYCNIAFSKKTFFCVMDNFTCFGVGCLGVCSTCLSWCAEPLHIPAIYFIKFREFFFQVSRNLRLRQCAQSVINKNCIFFYKSSCLICRGVPRAFQVCVGGGYVSLKIVRQKPINERNTFANEIIGPVIAFYILRQYFSSKNSI